jgi:hypothetical protein
MNMKDRSQSIVYINDLEVGKRPPANLSLRTGSAGFVFVGDDGSVGNDLQLSLSINSTHALMGHGVIEDLNKVEIQGRVGTGMDVLVPPSELEAVRQIFYRADSKTYGGTHEFVVGADADTEYRIRIDNREYQNTLSGLQYLLRTASHEGMAVWLSI